MLTNPIVITGTLRCGSSLVAHIFAAHDAWTGECQRGDYRNPNGYFENTAIKQCIQQRVDPEDLPKIFTSACEPQEWFRDFVTGVLEGEGYESGPWLVKQSALYWRLWDDFEPTWVLPRRDLSEVFASLRKAGFASWASDDELKRALTMIDGIVDMLRDERGGIEIDVAKLIGGDLGQINAALVQCGIDPDESTIRSIVTPAYWHGSC